LRQNFIRIAHLLKHGPQSRLINLSTLSRRGLQQTFCALKNERQFFPALRFRALPHLVGVTGHIRANLALACKVTRTTKGRHSALSVTARQGVTRHTTSAGLRHHLLLVESIRQRVRSRVRINLH
jgi:hypothetical protein